MTWYAGDPIEQMTFHMRYFGPWGPLFWTMVLCNCLIPLLLFSPRIRVNLQRALDNLNFHEYRHVARALS